MKVGDLVSFILDGFIEAGHGLIIEVDVPDHLTCDRSFRVLWNGHAPFNHRSNGRAAGWCYESDLVVVNESR